ncbi:MAG TPA: pyridoxine 5'-phosphate synthase [Thermoanaerobaculia bacterium]|nr:pyridoxine 5'-phosphate synthase [Thermoanaerobaculia bacterium]
MSQPVRLQVNVDHVATLRQTRRSAYPDPVELAGIALGAGASGITVHLRGDRRHIQDRDVRRLRSELDTRLNLEMAATPEMIQLALELQPDQVSLVPERPEEVTTEGGLDLAGRLAEVARAAEALAGAGIEVSLFLDPDPGQISRLEALSRSVRGFEINTDAYTRAPLPLRAEELAKVQEAAALGRSLGKAVFAGHGLTAANVGPIAAIPEVEELNIGHWLVCRSLTLGMAGAVAEMLSAMRR